MTTFAHVTDIHLPSLAFPSLSDLSMKQFLGLLNWYRSRRYLHRQTALDMIKTDLLKQNATHLIVSGDLVNLGLASEFKAGLKWLESLGSTEKVSFVPGNHDYYGAKQPYDLNSPFIDYMRSDALGASLGGGSGPDEPFVRTRDQIAFIGVNSAIPTPLFKAYGTVSEANLDQMGKILQKAKVHGFYRCIIVHHPPLFGLTSRSRAMTNDEDFSKTLKQFGAEMVLYGHNHLQNYTCFFTPDGPCHIIGTPSASIAKSGPYDLARYNLFNVKKQGQEWKTSLTGRGLEPKLEQVVTIEQRSLRGQR